MSNSEPSLMPAESKIRTESTVMSLLLVLNDQRPWSTEELIRTIGREMDTRDAIANLYAVGLLHRTTDGFVFPTRAATHLDALEM